MGGRHGRGECGVTASRYRISFWGDATVLTLAVMVIAQLGECVS